ncbi:hypothetical protein ABW19_dt0203412 [Dactylella cylindrospora]|nr:hypothetical protein ABW19_dt0203412 [Dactylella cylindrospora]
MEDKKARQYIIVKLDSAKLQGTGLEHSEAPKIFCYYDKALWKGSEYRVPGNARFELHVPRRGNVVKFDRFDGYVFYGARIKILSETSFEVKAKQVVLTTLVEDIGEEEKAVKVYRQVPYEKFLYRADVETERDFADKIWKFEVRDNQLNQFKLFLQIAHPSLFAPRPADAASAAPPVPAPQIPPSYVPPHLRAALLAQRAQDPVPSNNMVRDLEREALQSLLRPGEARPVVAAPAEIPDSVGSHSVLGARDSREGMYNVTPPSLSRYYVCFSDSGIPSQMKRYVITRTPSAQNVLLQLVDILQDKPNLRAIRLQLTYRDMIIWPINLELPFREIQVYGGRQRGLGIALGKMPKMLRIRLHYCIDFQRHDLDKNLSKMPELTRIDYL